MEIDNESLLSYPHEEEDAQICKVNMDRDN